MDRFRRLLLVACCSLGVAGAMAADEPAKRKFMVGFAQDTMANDWRAAQVRELKEALAAHADVEFIHTDAKGDTARQAQDIEDLAARGVDVLLTSPRDSELLREPIARVYRKGIPVILLSRRVSGDEFTQFISTDNQAIGRQAARYLAQRLGGKGRIFMLQGVPTASTAIDRTVGFEQELKKYPGLRISVAKPADYLRAMAVQRVEEVLAEQQPFDAIYAQSDSMALGAILALKKAGFDTRRIPIAGIDYIGEAREALRVGDLDATFTNPTVGREGAAAAIKLLRGGKLTQKVLIIPSVQVTRDNFDKVAPIF